jgi:hypothetical protein
MFVILPLIDKLRFISFDPLLDHDRGRHSRQIGAPDSGCEGET